jgi:hypothetical protein
MASCCAPTDRWRPWMHSGAPSSAGAAVAAAVWPAGCARCRGCARWRRYLFTRFTTRIRLDLPACGLCTVAQEKEGPAAPCGARLWQTHATVAVENAAAAPELAAAPTRTLVSHSGVDATRVATVMASIAAAVATPPLVQHLVMSVDQNASFVLQRADLYPAIAPDATVLWRSAQDGGAPCVVGSDAVASGCLAVGDAGTGALFDVSTQRSPCSQGGTFGRARSGACMHSVDVWQVFVAPPNATRVFLGDLSAYVSSSGYRFRLAPGGDATKVPIHSCYY